MEQKQPFIHLVCHPWSSRAPIATPAPPSPGHTRDLPASSHHHSVPVAETQANRRKQSLNGDLTTMPSKNLCRLVWSSHFWYCQVQEISSKLGILELFHVSSIQQAPFSSLAFKPRKYCTLTAASWHRMLPATPSPRRPKRVQKLRHHRVATSAAYRI